MICRGDGPETDDIYTRYARIANRLRAAPTEEAETERLTEAHSSLPTGSPAHLRALADWFDDPRNPEVMFDPGRWSRVTAGYALRRIADALEEV